jgi:acyl-CoA thioester hydrolase
MRVRYMEVDAQGVVFNAWYLAFFDEAMTAFLAARGASYATLAAAGVDVQLVHVEVDWTAGLRYADDFTVAVSTARVGRTSFALDFQARRDGEATCSARIVYVVMAIDGSGKLAAGGPGKRPVPALLAAALGDPAPLRGR